MKHVTDRYLTRFEIELEIWNGDDWRDARVVDAEHIHILFSVLYIPLLLYCNRKRVSSPLWQLMTIVVFL